MIILMNLFEFLNQQSSNRLIGYGILIVIIIAIIFEGIVEITKIFRKK